MVSPLLVFLAVLVVQVVGIATCRITVDVAANAAVRIAAAQGSSTGSALAAAQRYFIFTGFNSCGKVIHIYKKRESQTSTVVARIEQCLTVPVFNRQVRIVSESRQLDEDGP